MSMDLLAAGVALLGALLSGLFSALAYQANRRMRRGEIQRALSDQYDRLMRYRQEHPEVLPLSRRWKHSNIGLAYAQDDEEGRRWARYYAYAELCIGYCNSALYARRKNLMDELAFQAQHSPLVKLLLTENWPFFADVLVAPKYLSPLIAEYVEGQRQSGWDWLEEHRQIATLPDAGQRTAMESVH